MQEHIVYAVDFSRFYDHLADVTITFQAPSDEPILWLPTWIAGSYLIREFSKHITRVSYRYSTQDESSSEVATKITKNHYCLSKVKTGDWVSVCYEVYCHDLSVRTAFIDHTRLFGNFTSLLLMVQGCEQALCSIRLSVPKAFFVQNPKAVLASGLAHKVCETEQGLSLIHI